MYCTPILIFCSVSSEFAIMYWFCCGNYSADKSPQERETYTLDSLAQALKIKLLANLFNTVPLFLDLSVLKCFKVGHSTTFTMFKQLYSVTVLLLFCPCPSSFSPWFRHVAEREYCKYWGYCKNDIWVRNNVPHFSVRFLNWLCLYINTYCNPTFLFFPFLFFLNWRYQVKRPPTTMGCLPTPGNLITLFFLYSFAILITIAVCLFVFFIVTVYPPFCDAVGFWL